MAQRAVGAPWCVYQLPLPPASHMGEVEASSECCTHRGLVLQLRNPELRGSQPFITVCKEANMPDLFPEGGIIFIIWTVNKSAFCSDRHYLLFFQRCSLYRHPWKDIPEQRLSVTLLTSHGETRETPQELSPNWDLHMKEIRYVICHNLKEGHRPH